MWRMYYCRTIKKENGPGAGSRIGADKSSQAKGMCRNYFMVVKPVPDII